jgi:hypothetical protein
MLFKKMGEVWDQILNDRHMGQRIQPDDIAEIIKGLRARQSIHAVYIHCAGATNTLPTRPPER